MPEFAIIKKRGRPSHAPNDMTRRLVQFLKIAGYRETDIADAAGIGASTLSKHYRDELDNAKPRVDAQMTSTLVMLGTGGPGEGAWKSANVAANLFYHKAYMGKNERQQIMHSGAVGSYDLSKLTDEQLEQLERILSLTPASESRGDPSGASAAFPA